MRCPFCAHEDSQVKDSRPSEDGAAIRRRRQCEGCGARFTTFERIQLRELTVIKKDGEREPFDPLPPMQTSGIRVGSPAGTTRGFGEREFRDIADMVADVLDGLATNGPDNNGSIERDVNGRVRELCARFPIYQG